MKTFGIDVSKWQGVNFNFNQAKNEGVKFVILRGAYATSKDSQFENYYSKCKSLGLPIGVYHYSMATTVAQAKKEAEFLHNNVLKGKQFELPIYIDVEDKVQLALSKDALTNIVRAWCEYLEQKNYYVGIYASKWTFDGELNDAELKRYTHWIAQWYEKCTYNGNVDMWQFGGERNALRSTKICGQTVDQDYMYKDFPTIIKKAKKNGFKVETTYFPKVSYTGVSLIEGLKSIDVNNSFSYRSKIAAKNNIVNYAGTAQQNTTLLNLLKQGKLMKP